MDLATAQPKRYPHSLAEYQQRPGTKITAMMDILLHHQKAPRQYILRNHIDGANPDDDSLFDNWSNELIESTDRPEEVSSAAGEPDKIVVYQSFPAHAQYFKIVSPLVNS